MFTPITHGLIAFIPIVNHGGRLWAKVDAEDAPNLLRFKWRLQRDGYAQAWNRGSRGRRTMRMHQLIAGRWVDHRNRKRLDNRRENLRPCTQQQNMRNQGARMGKKYKGAKWSRRAKRWVAEIRTPGKRLYLGGFLTEEAAARAYDAAARIHHGEFAYLNFPTEAA